MVPLGSGFLNSRWDPSKPEGQYRRKGEWLSSTVSSTFYAESDSFNPHKSLLKWVLLHSPRLISEKLKLREVK